MVGVCDNVLLCTVYSKKFSSVSLKNETASYFTSKKKG